MNSRLVAGRIWQGEILIARFFVHWTLGKSRHPANFDLILGDHDEGAPAAKRIGVSLSYRNDAEGQGFMVIDAGGRPFADPAVVGKGLSRAEVVGTPLAQEAFDLVDCIFLSDPQFREIETVA